MLKRTVLLSFLWLAGSFQLANADLMDDCREHPVPNVRLQACNDIIARTSVDLNTKAVAYQYRGNGRLEAGAFQQAIADFSEAIHINPSSSPSFAGRARAKFSTRDFLGAVADFTEALRHAPNASELYMERGHVYLLLGNVDASIIDLTKAISLNPNSASALNNRGFAFRRKGQFDSALRDYSAAIEINPAYALAYANRGYLQLARGDRSAAIGDLRRALLLDPSLITARNALRKLGSETSVAAESDRLVRDGHLLAEQNCRSCHAIGIDGKSTNIKAPEFRNLKRRHALIALREPITRGIAAPHENMPQFLLTADQTDAIIAYINSLPAPK